MSLFPQNNKADVALRNIRKSDDKNEKKVNTRYEIVRILYEIKYPVDNQSIFFSDQHIKKD